MRPRILTMTMRTTRKKKTWDIMERVKRTRTKTAIMRSTAGGEHLQ